MIFDPKNDTLKKQVKTPLIVALDYANREDALMMADMLDPELCRVKVGKELYTRAGPEILERLHERNFQVFLDLKFHDIPNTTANAVAAAADMGVWMVNVHASGGRKMMEACVNKLANYRNKPLLIGVTVLTSLSAADLVELGISLSPFEQVHKLAGLARTSGLDGVVCSAQEAQSLKEQFGPEFKLITPGIRPVFSEQGDQHRVMTPASALAAGSDYLVIGRPITQAKNPQEVIDLIISEMGTSH